jgi:hypothetical protein
MISLLIFIRSKVDHVKTSLFWSRKASNSACSCWSVSALMHMALLGTPGSRGTFLNSPSALMAFLYSAGASALRWPVEVLRCSNSSRRKCIFL